MPVEFDSYDPDATDSLPFENGGNAHTILAFLADHPGKGFTPKEIHDATDIPRGSVGVTLSRLHEHNLVKHKEPYWAIGDDDRLAAIGAKASGDSRTDRSGSERKSDWVSDAD